MAELEYSNDAINVINKFYASDVVVYVEGDDDIPFWMAIFSAFSNLKVAVEAAGGCKELDKFADRVEVDGVNLIVARDADYSMQLGARSISPKVLYTFGYSIENSLYTEESIREISMVARRTHGPEEHEVRLWLNDLIESLRPVVVYDLASAMDGLGVVALSDNCESYMVNKSSPLVSAEKVDKRISQIGAKISEDSKYRAEELIVAKGGYDCRILRGHVLSSAVLRFVREHSGRSGISGEVIYTSAISFFKHNVSKGHPHAEFYKEMVDLAVSALT